MGPNLEELIRVTMRVRAERLGGAMPTQVVIDRIVAETLAAEPSFTRKDAWIDFLQERIEPACAWAWTAAACFQAHNHQVIASEGWERGFTDFVPASPGPGSGYRSLLGAVCILVGMNRRCRKSGAVAEFTFRLPLPWLP